MGISSSRLAEKISENAAIEKQSEQDPENANREEQGSIPSTPILTPKIIRENIEKDYLDPRSPSRHIARTPIELLPAAAEKLKSLTLKSNERAVPTETPLKKHILLGIDPRSPTLEFQRTPIVLSASPDKKLPEKIRNKNLDKVLKCALPTTPNNKITPPRLLESCLVTPKPKLDAYKRKSFVLLETNVDFTETDLDNVLKEKYLGKSLQNLYAPEETSYSEIIDPRSPATDFLRTPIQICQQVENPINVQTIEKPSEQSENKDVENEKEIELQNRETSVNIEEFASTSVQSDPHLLNNKDHVIEDLAIVQLDNTDFTETEPPDCNNLKPETEQHLVSADTIISESLAYTRVPETEEAIIVTPCKKSLAPKREKIIVSPILKVQPHVPKSAPVSPPSVVSVTPKKSKSQPVTPPPIDLTADVKELDKKLTHLIYEDEKDLVICPRIVKVKDQNRTPLGLRNGTENKKSSQKLKVSDKPRKAEYTVSKIPSDKPRKAEFSVSKIPVFKEKKIKIQCENTPPRGMRSKKSQWDAKDDTMVI